MGVYDLVKALRPKQYYKNLLVFLPLIFSGNVTHPALVAFTFVGFIALCLTSSSTYIINDIIDVNRDRLHHEKKNRPIASGKIRMWEGIIICVLLLTAAVFIGSQLSLEFTYMILLLFLFTLLYSVWLKHEAFIDIIAIGVNFIIRAVAGAFIIDVMISSWLILGVFFLSLFLSAGKRHSDALLLKGKASAYRKTLKWYTKDITNALMMLTTVLLVMSYALYTFFSDHKGLITTLPFALYVIFRYFWLVLTGNKIARHPEYVFTDKRMVIGMICWVVLTLILLYY